MKKIGVFLSAAPRDGGMFQYSQAVLSALVALPADEYSLLVAYADPRWREHIPGCVAAVHPVRLGRLAPRLALAAALLPASSARWGRALIRFSAGAEHWLDDHWFRERCRLWVFPQQDAWSAWFPLPVLASVHDLMHRYEPHFPEVSSRGRSRYRDGYLRRLCRRANGILVDSEIGKRQVQESYGTPEGKLFVLPYIPPAYLSDPGRDADFEKKYCLPPKYVFYPAQFWQHKNHVRLINAIAEVRRKHPDICLVLAGSKNNGYGAARREVARLGLERHVRFSGYVPARDMAEFYRRARGLVLPTLFGPTNIPPLEAFSLGCPVAVSGIYGMPEQVGDAGLLFDPHSVPDMASAIAKLWVDDDLCQKLRARGKTRAAAWGPAQFAAALRHIVRQVTC
jgi:glycosyltransferase involved in cell wall biosynthesis